MLRGLFHRKPKHERLEEEPEVRFKGLLVSERDLGYTYIRPGGKTEFILYVEDSRLSIKWSASVDHI